MEKTNKIELKNCKLLSLVFEKIISSFCSFLQCIFLEEVLENVIATHDDHASFVDSLITIKKEFFFI